MPATPLRLAPLAAVLLLGGCLEHPLKNVEYEKLGEGDGIVDVAINKDVDILFVIDNSGSMAEEQALLSQNFGAFIGKLEAPEVRANYRIGVTTTDAGNPRCPSSSYTPENGNLVLSSCVGRVDQGEFDFNDQDFSYACTDYCGKTDDELRILPTKTEVDDEARPRKWLESIEGQTNVEGVDSMVEAFQCFGPQGVAGCGFESHLESMYKALAAAKDRNSVNNYGFLRERAILSVVFITDEADCSYAPEHKAIFTDNKVFWNDPNDPAPTSSLCWKAGVACSGASPYGECHAENYGEDGSPGVSDAEAVLQPVSKYVDFVQGIEDAKRKQDGAAEVLVSLIAGVPVGYDKFQAELTYEDAADPDYQANFGVGPGCILPSGDPDVPDATAVPPVREREFAEAFQVGEDSRNLYSICQTDYSAALQAIADKVADQIKPACMPSCVFDEDESTPFAEPNCQLYDVDLATDTRTEIVKCVEVDGAWTAPAGAAACFVELVDRTGEETPSALDDMSTFCADQGLNLEFQLIRAAAAPANTTVKATCQLSKNKPRDCPNL
jgi:hypothetical protein